VLSEGGGRKLSESEGEIRLTLEDKRRFAIRSSQTFEMGVYLQTQLHLVPLADHDGASQSRRGRNEIRREPQPRTGRNTSCSNGDRACSSGSPSVSRLASSKFFH
jgi:hypothetical protein